MVLFLHQPTLLHLLLSLFFFFLVGWFCLVLFWVMFSILCPDRNFNECKTKALVPSWAQWMNQVGVCLRSPAYWQFFVPLWPKCWSVWPVTREACFQKILDIFKIYIYMFHGWNWSKIYKATKQVWNIPPSSLFQTPQK